MTSGLTLRHEFCVSPAGDDANPGTREAPFRSIGQAQKVVRSVIAKGMDDDVVVFLGGGAYDLDAPLRLTEEDSGRNGFRVVYRNVPDETPVIRGGRRIGHWIRHAGDIYKAQIDPAWHFSCLFENGQRATMARLPKQGYFTVERSAPEARSKSFIFQHADLPNPFDIRDAQVYVWPGEAHWNWFSQTQPITHIDWGTRKLVMREEAVWDIDTGARYFVQGPLDFLTEPGEFSLDAITGTLYYWPRQTPIDDQDIVAPTVKRVIDCRGASPATPVHDIVFHGLTLEVSDFGSSYRMPVFDEGQDEPDDTRDGLVYVTNATDITVRSCKIAHAGLSGVTLDRFAQRITIADNLIHDLGYNGVYLTGWSIGQGDFASAADAYVNKNNRIANNLVIDGGKLVGHGSGIQLVDSGNNEISNNEVARMPRYGISLKGLRFGVMKPEYYGTSVTWENHWDFNHARNNRIAHNNIHHVLLDSQDAGGFEAWGCGTQNVLDGNLIHDIAVGVPGGMTFGIYLDDAADDFTIVNNIVHSISASEGGLIVPMYIKGIGHTIANNIVAGNGGDCGIRFHAYCGERNDRMILAHNIIVLDEGDAVYRFVDWSDDKVLRSDWNVFSTKSGRYDVTGFPDGPGYEAWMSPGGRNFEEHSVLADPRFADSANHIYELHPDSPAIGLGFAPIDQASIGLTTSFPFLAAHSALTMELSGDHHEGN